MSSHPTCHSAYFLRGSNRGREQVFQLPNHRDFWNRQSTPPSTKIKAYCTVSAPVLWSRIVSDVLVGGAVQLKSGKELHWRSSPLLGVPNTGQPAENPGAGQSRPAFKSTAVSYNLSHCRVTLNLLPG